MGHSLATGKDVLDFPAGSRIYLPDVRRYFIVEDTCGDGNDPQNGPCHQGANADGTNSTLWIDMWIGGESMNASGADNCAGKVTDRPHRRLQPCEQLRRGPRRRPSSMTANATPATATPSSRSKPHQRTRPRNPGWRLRPPVRVSAVGGVKGSEDPIGCAYKNGSFGGTTSIPREGDMRRIRSFGGAAMAAFCLATVLTACLPGAVPPPPRLDPQSSESTSESASASPTDTAAPETEAPPTEAPQTEAPEAEWKTFTTADQQLEFDYPPDWTIKDRAIQAAPWGVFVEVLNGAGKTMAALRTNIVITAECPQRIPYFLMDLQDLPVLAQAGVTPRFTFEGRAAPDGNAGKSITMAYGITSAAPPSGSTACPIFQFFTWPGGWAMFGGIHPLRHHHGEPLGRGHAGRTRRGHTRRLRGDVGVRRHPADDHLTPAGGAVAGLAPPAGRSEETSRHCMRDPS